MLFEVCLSWKYFGKDFLFNCEVFWVLWVSKFGGFNVLIWETTFLFD